LAELVEKQKPVRVHDHEFMEIVVIVGGSCFHQHILGEHRAGKADVFLLRPGAWHSYNDCQNLKIYNCCFDPGILGRELGWMIDDPNLGRLLWNLPLSPAQRGMVLLRLPDSELAACQEILDKLSALTTVSLVSYRADRVGLLVQLLGVLSRQLPDEANLPKSAKPHPAILAALKLMDNNPTREWSLETLAAQVHVRPGYLTRMFATVAGLPPMAYLRRRRLELATTLLANSKRPVSEVSNLVGWPNSNYFTRRFRTEFGLSPRAYRARFVKVRGNSKKAPSRKAV
jgi:AraC family L-rhamnose operon transcriptional activator RhaR